MFRASIAPIIRSTKNCNCSLLYRSYYVTVQRPSSNVACGLKETKQACWVANINFDFATFSKFRTEHDCNFLVVVKVIEIYLQF